MDAHNFFFFKYIYKCIMANSSKLHTPPTNYHFLAAQQEPYEKSLTLNEKIFEFFWKEVRRMDH